MSRAVVVGGASGIGFATAQALHDDGFRVTIADVNLEAAQAAAAQIGGDTSAIPMDVTDEASVAAGFAGIDDLTSVVSCPGLTFVGAITELSFAAWQKTVDVCLTGTFLVLKHAGLAIAEGGSITVISSLNARQPGTGMGAYCASKAGATMLVEVAALESAARRVRVNAIQPGRVETPMTAGSDMVPGLIDQFTENTPLGRSGQPKEIADVAAFLASDKATWITGATFDINGGAHLQKYPDMLELTRPFATQP
ncbi:SDR family NAD(P)-dependent oxidoreductase [Agromyces albus]|uniref:SDR family oxidoreductase n=1 Tax=Agromyces albus TaxID=205332 RepID=A0A4Q2KRK6_9MICO|nr:SDR family NAD(P)-dependent oxidoreductase [Agromyces albus]RXZ68075.1 SDR family oxidoreductase [Agromyces albus]